MRKQGIDLVLLPIFALPPVPMGGSGTATLIAANYAFLFNIVSLFILLFGVFMRMNGTDLLTR